jgi:hypothetical protein
MIAKRFKKKSNFMKSKWISLKPVAFWNMPLRVFLSCYSILSLSALMTIEFPKWDFTGPAIDTFCSILGLAVTAFFPLIVLYIMIRYFPDFELKDFKSSFGSLYEGLDTQNKWIIAYRFWFLLRRLLLAVTVVYVDKLTFQFCIWFAQELLTLVILGFGQPFELQSDWWSEYWNEVFILSTIYFIMFFSPYISQVEILDGIGYVFCGVLFFHLIVNIIIIAV